MQSNTFRICKDRDSLYEILKEVEKCASYTGIEKKEYFQHSIDEVHREIQTEYNMDRNPIGFFVIVDGENIQLLSYRDTIIDNPTRILELIYSYGCYNIFLTKRFC